MAFASALVVDAETLYSDGAVLSLTDHNGAVESVAVAPTMKVEAAARGGFAAIFEPAVAF